MFSKHEMSLSGGLGFLSMCRGLEGQEEMVEIYYVLFVCFLIPTCF